MSVVIRVLWRRWIVLSGVSGQGADLDGFRFCARIEAPSTLTVIELLPVRMSAFGP